MGVSDANAVYGPNARFTHKPISFYNHLTIVSQTGLEIFEHTPGYNFEIVGFEVYAESVVATISFNLLIEAVSVITPVLTPVALAGTAAVMLATGVEYGSATDVIYVQYTSNGTGETGPTNFQIWIRRRAADVT